MAQDFLFEHFLKVNKKDKEISPFNNQVVENQSEFDSEELNVINNEVLNHLKTIVPEIKFKT